MPTRNIVPRANNEGSIGTTSKSWSEGHFTKLTKNGIAVATLPLSSIQTNNFTAVSGNIYICDTTALAFSVTLPASPAIGDQVTLVDAEGTWLANPLTIVGGTNLIYGNAGNFVCNASNQQVVLIFVGGVKGWNVYVK